MGAPRPSELPIAIVRSNPTRLGQECPSHLGTRARVLKLSGYLSNSVKAT